MQVFVVGSGGMDRYSSPYILPNMRVMSILFFNVSFPTNEQQDKPKRYKP